MYVTSLENCQKTNETITFFDKFFCKIGPLNYFKLLKKLSKRLFNDHMLTRKRMKFGSGLPGVRLSLDPWWIRGGVAPGDGGGGDGEVCRALLLLLSSSSGGGVVGGGVVLVVVVVVVVVAAANKIESEKKAKYLNIQYPKNIQYPILRISNILGIS